VLIGHDVTHDDGVGYDNLMQVIRADVRDPLREPGRALAVGGPHAPSWECSAPAGVVDRLVDLARSGTVQRLLATDRIELWPLLQHAWGGVEPLALQRGGQGALSGADRGRRAGHLYGSEHWLGRVFEECLEAAVRSARRGATLEIEHRRWARAPW
jgi:hypothetical protein